MRSRKQAGQTLPVPNAGERDVQQEIDNFLRALRSYPDRFAREPDLSFQQHLSSFGAAANPPTADERRSR